MKTSSPWARAALLLSCVGLLPPQSAVASVQQSPLPAVKTLDVALAPEGALCGALVDPQGIAVPNARVIVLQGPTRAADITTDAKGRFATAPLRPGVYLVAAAGTVKTVRVWVPAGAPPTAARGVLMISNEKAMRAQSDWYQWISENYILFCCGVAAAITVPVCLISANDHDTPASP